MSASPKPGVGIGVGLPRALSYSKLPRFEGLWLCECAVLHNDLSGFVVRKYQGETRAKTRHPDDCVAIRTDSIWGCARVARPFFWPQSVCNRLAIS